MQLALRWLAIVALLALGIILPAFGINLSHWVSARTYPWALLSVLAISAACFLLMVRGPRGWLIVLALFVVGVGVDHLTKPWEGQGSIIFSLFLIAVGVLWLRFLLLPSVDRITEPLAHADVEQRRKIIEALRVYMVAFHAAEIDRACQVLRSLGDDPDPRVREDASSLVALLQATGTPGRAQAQEDTAFPPETQAAGIPLTGTAPDLTALAEAAEEDPADDAHEVEFLIAILEGGTAARCRAAVERLGEIGEAALPALESYRTDDPDLRIDVQRAIDLIRTGME